MTVLAGISVALIVVAAGLYVAMLRRDDTMLGLAGLITVITAAVGGLVYAILDSL